MATVSVSFHGFGIQMQYGVCQPGAKQRTATILFLGKPLKGCLSHQLLMDSKRFLAAIVTQSFYMSQNMQGGIQGILL